MPLHYGLQSGDTVEIITSKRERGPSRDWLALVKTTRARNKIKAWFKAESRDDSEHTGRELLQEHLNKAGLPSQKLTGSPLLADVIRELGFKKADDFYIALGGAKISPKVVVNKVMQRLKQGEAGVEEPTAGEDLLLDRRKAPALRRPDGNAAKFGIRVEGVADVPLRLAKCCRPSPATRSSATSRSAAGSRSTATTARTSPPCARTRSASSRSPGTATTRPASRSRSRSTPGTATACSRTSAAPSRRPGSTSSRRAASSSTR